MTPTFTVPPPRITVWLDSARMEGANIYRGLFPEKAARMDFREVDRERFPDAVLEFNRQGGGWPDVVFAETNLIARTVDAEHDYSLDLRPLLPAGVLDNFEPHANDACTFGGKLLCLRHDTAPMVLYYSRPLMEQFGYRVPATWEEYEALGERVGREHPGYVVGSFGDAWGFKAYFDASGCPSSLVLDDRRVQINFADPRCLRAAKLVDRLLANGTLAPGGYFDPGFLPIPRADKLLTLIGPAWLALAGFGGRPGSPYYETADHRLGVAAPPHWEGEPAQTSTMGGGAWAVSRHAQDPELALDFVLWMVGAPEFWSVTPDYPVYEPVQPAWQRAANANPLFANDPFPVMQAASQAISPLYVLPAGYDVMGILNDFVGRALGGKRTLESLLPDLQAEMTDRAEAAGYDVIVEPD